LASLDREFVRDEDEFAPEHDPFAPDEHGQSELEPQQRWLPSLWVLLSMAVAGVVLALIWHNVKPKISFASLSTQTPSAAAAPATVQDPASNQDLDALKRSIAELRDTQQQLLAKIAGLETAQQHMQQQLAAHSTLRWYSDSNILMYRTATVHPPKPSTPPKPKPVPATPSDPQDANASHLNRSSLPLAPGRP
jgi:hypothetical protein